MESLYAKIDTARQFTEAPSGAVDAKDDSPQAVIGLDWASRQKPAQPEDVAQLKPIFPVPN